jgi:hypothetical protein
MPVDGIETSPVDCKRKLGKTNNKIIAVGNIADYLIENYGEGLPTIAFDINTQCGVARVFTPVVVVKRHG